MNTYPKNPRAWWPKIAAERAAGMSGLKLAQRYGVGSIQTIHWILEMYRREQNQTLLSIRV